MAPHLFVPKDLCPHPLSSYVGKNYGGIIIEPYCANCLTYLPTYLPYTIILVPQESEQTAL